jgi:tRNA(Ile2)-agmatinylcytidine synthase
MAWVPGDSTYELIAYRGRERWGTERAVDPDSIRKMDSMFPRTFNSWEERTSKVTMVPSTPCPVLYGLRGDTEDDLLPASGTIVSELADRWTVFLTNQGTDDHIISGPTELIAGRSYSLDGTVSGRARHMKGGHVFIDIGTEFGTVTCGAYEPSKEFRMLFDHLIPGDTLTVLGELRSEPRTLNVEKVCVTGLANDERRSNPACPVCGKNMKSAGKGQGYRCRECRTRAKEPVTCESPRSVVPGWYEPPAAARRHLSKPLKRMGKEQPAEFIRPGA